MKKLSLKLFIIFSFTFLLFILSNSNVYASNDLTINVSGHDLVIPGDIIEAYPYFYINNYFVDVGDYAILFGTSPFTFEYGIQDGKKYLFDVYSSNIVFAYVRKNDFANPDFSSCKIPPTSTSNKEHMIYFTHELNLVYANHDIKDIDGNLVFQVAPAATGQIATKITSVDFSMVLLEVLGLLPMILVIVIGLIALMKAIKLLFSIFQNA